jgi:hypothetical protein
MFVDLHSATGKKERVMIHYYHDLSVSSGAGSGPFLLGRRNYFS